MTVHMFACIDRNDLFFFFFFQMFALTVASSGSQRHFKFVQDTDDMMVKALFSHLLFMAVGKSAVVQSSGVKFRVQSVSAPINVVTNT